MGGVTNTTTVTDSLNPALFADGTAALAHPVSDTLDIVLSTGSSPFDRHLRDWFLSSTIGLRYNLP